MMESQITTILLSLFIILVTVTTTFKVIKSKSGLPPSPWGLPIIGHLHLLGRLPHQSLHKLALQHGGLIFLKLGTVSVVVASTSDAAKEILKTHDAAFASRPATPSGEHLGYKGAGLVWASYGQHWRDMRKLCTLELLSSKRVELSQPVRKYEVSLLLNELLSNHCNEQQLPVDLTNKLADLTFNIIARMVMNKSFSGARSTDSEKDEIADFRTMVTEALAVRGFSSVAQFLPWLKWMDKHIAKVKVIKQFVDEFLEKQIAEHRKQQLRLGGHPPRDFIDVMMSLEENSLGDDSMKSLSLDMIAAGTDTSAATVEWALAELVRHPELLLRAQQELKDVVGENRTMDEGDLPKLSYLTAVVKETLRLHPPGPLLIPHESTQPCKVGSYFIPAGTQAFVNVYAIARDSAHWKQPLEFDPSRFMDSSNAIDVKGQSFEFLPFGSGRRSCPGTLLGMTTVQMILGSLLHAFEWRLPDGVAPEELDMSEVFGMTVRRAKSLKLLPAARLNSEAYAPMEDL